VEPHAPEQGEPSLKCEREVSSNVPEPDCVQRERARLQKELLATFKKVRAIVGLPESLLLLHSAVRTIERAESLPLASVRVSALALSSVCYALHGVDVDASKRARIRQLAGENLRGAVASAEFAWVSRLSALTV
jgi:hypothetical protein